MTSKKPTVKANPSLTYIKQAMRTASGSYYGEHINKALVERQLRVFIEAGQKLDVIKKAMFYGKDIENFKTVVPSITLGHAPMFFHESTAKGELILHGLIGVLTEATELAEHLQVVLAGESELDSVNVKEEIADCMWYMAILADTMGFTFEEVQATNISKLKARYPEKFTEEKAVNRDLDTERKILETK